MYEEYLIERKSLPNQDCYQFLQQIISIKTKVLISISNQKYTLDVFYFHKTAAITSHKSTRNNAPERLYMVSIILNKLSHIKV